MPSKKYIIAENDAFDRAVDGEEEVDETGEEEEDGYAEQSR
jgi:hypothetical protein